MLDQCFITFASHQIIDLSAMHAPCWQQHGACTPQQAVSNAAISEAVLRATVQLQYASARN